MPGTNNMTVLRCLDCGKCTSVCPVARAGNTYSPRRVIRGLVEGRTEGMGDAVWSCLTCMYCDTRCPQEVPVAGAMPPLRHQSRLSGEKPPFTRCSAMDAVAAIQSQAQLAQDRMNWIPPDVKIDPQSKTLFFVGCLPYFDAFFTETQVNTLESAVATIRILNALGIEPAVLPDERCCGHDQLWSGDEEVFERLAKMNVAMFKRVQPEMVVTVCPECSMTLARDYRERYGVPNCEIKHISQLLAEDGNRLSLSPRAVKATFQDPCRLGRHMGIYEAPREVIASVPELELTEMLHNRQKATCCAGSWMLCNQTTKKIQTNLLREAVSTGSELLVTACPKCKIHLRCAQSGNEGGVEIEIRDLASVIADLLTDSAEGR